jgi:hypothetical protein
MDSERPPSSRVEAFGGPNVANARGALREALGAVRNLAQLLHSLRVAPKSLAQVLPDVLEACTPMRASVQTLLAAVAEDEAVEPARKALESFFDPRILELEAALRDAMSRPLNAKSRLALEDVVAKCSFELGAARELLQLLENALCERPVRLVPRELVRESFSSPPSARSEGRELVSATLSSHDCGQEIEIKPRVAMFLISVGVELVGARAGRENPHILISSDGHGTCSILIRRMPNPTGEPLVLASRGILEPTLPCLHSAASVSGGQLEWSASTGEFSLSYPLDGGAVRVG